MYVYIYIYIAKVTFAWGRKRVTRDGLRLASKTWVYQDLGHEFQWGKPD